MWNGLCIAQYRLAREQYYVHLRKQNSYYNIDSDLKEIFEMDYFPVQIVLWSHNIHIFFLFGILLIWWVGIKFLFTRKDIQGKTTLELP